MNVPPPYMPQGKPVEALTEFTEQVGESISNTAETISNTVNDVVEKTQEQTQGMFSDFSSSKLVEGSEEFITSNSIIAKISFFLLVLVIFIIVMKTVIWLFNWIYSIPAAVHLTDGMVGGNVSRTFSQDPEKKDSKIILRSVNQEEGLEFTWSVWMFINELPTVGTKGNVFIKGGMGVESPSVYVTRNVQDPTVEVRMNTFGGQEIATINNVPMKKWFNLMIRCSGKNVDLYVNGIIAVRHELQHVAKQNYGNVVLHAYGGYDGYTSNLWYFNRAISTMEIADIARKGPNLKELSETGPENKKMKSYNYLSLQWFIS